MLHVPELDDLGFERIFRRARSGIAELTEEWTDENYHDPGITMLHTFAWLTDMLLYSIDATGEAHRLKYLKLLGLRPQASPARCVLGIDAPQAEVSIPSGTRVAAGDIVFETCADYRELRNRLVRLVAGTEGDLSDVTPDVARDKSWARVFSRGGAPGQAVYFGFEREMSEDTRFYIEVWEGYRRNPFGEDFSLVRTAWECYADGGWRPADVLEDGTCGLLRSGFLSLLLPEETEPFETPDLPRAHYLRCRMTKGSYDVPPRIGTVTVNCVPAEQTHTRARLLEAVSDGGEWIEIGCYVRENDFVAVALREGEEYVLCRDCAVERSASPGRAAVRFASLPIAGQEVLIAVLARDFAQEAVLGRTDGCAGGRFDLPDAGSVCELRLALFAGDRFTLWERCEDVELAGSGAMVFSCDAARGQAVFGDGLHGLQPEAGLTVAALHLRTSLFGEGNALRGRVCEVLDPIQPDGARLQNLADARGGRTPEPAEELCGRLEERLFSPARAVNAADYRALVLATPGLAIDLVNIVTMRDYARAAGAPYRPNTVVAVVKPYSDGERPALSESYRRIIRAHLERYRLLTTDVLVVGARYVGVGVTGRVEVRGRAREARGAVEKLLRERIDFEKTRAFGGVVSRAELFAAIGLQRGVRAVTQLSFEAQGAGASRNERGDVIAAPDCLLYLREVGIDYAGDCGGEGGAMA